jgi:hypothetical protein
VNESPYRHTQIGWLMIAVLAMSAAVMWGVAYASNLPDKGLFGVAVVGVLLPLFGTLSVTVDEQQLRARFGIGLIGKRIDLRDVRFYEEVRNPWAWGFGIRFYPGGTLYNVSGLSAVELVLHNGRRVRIGTDDPEGLRQAIRRAIGDPKPLGPEEAFLQKSASKARSIALAIVIVIALVVPLGIAMMMHYESGPPKTEVLVDRFSVKSFAYHEEIAFRDVSSITLETTLPRILRRTNGYAASGTLRGHFDVAGLGNGQLFIQADRPPFVLVRATDRFLIVNFEDPLRTQTFYEELTERWTNAKSP